MTKRQYHYYLSRHYNYHYYCNNYYRTTAAAIPYYNYLQLLVPLSSQYYNY